jgi:hypothetical protein
MAPGRSVMRIPAMSFPCTSIENTEKSAPPADAVCPLARIS